MDNERHGGKSWGRRGDGSFVLTRPVQVFTVIHEDRRTVPLSYAEMSDDEQSTKDHTQKHGQPKTSVQSQF